MKDQKSPCLQCERLAKDKFECAETCKELEFFQERLPLVTLWRGDPIVYNIPHFQRTRTYRSHE